MNPSPSQWLVAGLGNPGKEYALTRHNIGFMVLDAIAAELQASDWRSRFGAAYLVRPELILVKPMTFMNESGGPLQAIAHYYRIPPEHCLVVSDDLDLPYGKLRMRLSGGHGGQNGLRSIITTLGEGFPRLRVGIGRSHEAVENASIQRVLGNFSSPEQVLLKDVIAAAITGILTWLRDGRDPAMRFINTWSVAAETTERTT